VQAKSPVPWALSQRGRAAGRAYGTQVLRHTSPGYRANPLCHAKSEGILDAHDPTRASTTGNYRYGFPAAETVSPSCCRPCPAAGHLCLSVCPVSSVQQTYLESAGTAKEQQTCGRFGPRDSTPKVANARSTNLPGIVAESRRSTGASG
jgi:hypothetical protein